MLPRRMRERVLFAWTRRINETLPCTDNFSRVERMNEMEDCLFVSLPVLFWMNESCFVGVWTSKLCNFLEKNKIKRSVLSAVQEIHYTTLRGNPKCRKNPYHRDLFFTSLDAFLLGDLWIGKARNESSRGANIYGNTWMMRLCRSVSGFRATVSFFFSPPFRSFPIRISDGTIISIHKQSKV
jgi:hypothetical protein